MIEEFEHEMLQEFAETLLACTNYVNQSLNQNDLYALIGSGIENLQKAAFVVLRFFYQNFIPELKFSTSEDSQIQEIRALAVQQKAEHANDSDEEVKEHEQQNSQEDMVAQNKVLQNIPSNLLSVLDDAPNINQKEDNDEVENEMQD